MKKSSRVRHILGTALAMVVLCAATGLLLAGSASAEPITYIGFTVTDGKLGSWSFHNARVFLTFDSDTSNVQFTNILGVDVGFNPVGIAQVTVVTDDRSVSATFNPNQIFVSVDLANDQNSVFLGARGIGFGSCFPSCLANPNQLEPAYPLGIEDGTVDWGDVVEQGGVASSALYNLSNDLTQATAFSGRAWVCPGFPAQPSPCNAPQALKTDKGDFYLFQPYQAFDPQFNNFFDTLSGGIFLAFVGEGRALAHTLPLYASPLPIGGDGIGHTNNPVTYTAFFISDVTIGGHQYSSVPVFLRFDGDASTVRASADGSAYSNSVGSAHVNVITGNRIVHATLAPGQVYVYLDSKKSAVGFGSQAGGAGYPLSLVGIGDDLGLTTNSLVAAVTDIMQTPADKQFYTPSTANLVTDLTKSTTLSGGASSCAGSFDPAVGMCPNVAAAVPLQTNLGPLYFYEPFYMTDSVIAQPFSINWGIFWITAK